MKHILEDGRTLVVSYADIQDFFSENKIIGRVISDIRPAAFDYMIQNLGDIYDIYEKRTECMIQTDSRICVLFEDGDHLEIEYCGDGPIILGFNTADFGKYPEPDGTCYTLHTMFQYCLGYQIVNIIFDRSPQKMKFPSHHGFDMSEDDEGVKEIRILLRGGTSLIASGSIDCFTFKHVMDFGGAVTIPFRSLLDELSDETLADAFVEELSCTKWEELELEAFSIVEIVEDVYHTFGKFGFKDKGGNVIIEPQYLSCGEFHCGMCPVAIGRTWLKSKEGHRYYEMHWGYIDTLGKVVIPFKFKEAWNFNKYGAAVVKDGYTEETYIIDVKGNKLPNSSYIYLSHYYDFSDRFFEFSNVDINADNNMGLYDTKERRVFLQPITQGTIECSEDKIIVYETGNLGYADWRQHYINSNGEELYPGLSDRGFGIVDEPNDQGFAVVCCFEWEEAKEGANSWSPMNGKKYERHDRYGVANLDGELVVPMLYDKIYDMKNGQFECRKNGEAVVISVLKQL